MSVEQIKEELKLMDAPLLQELTAYILQLRRRLDPERKQEIANRLDATRWVSLEEMNQRLDRE